MFWDQEGMARLLRIEPIGGWLDMTVRGGGRRRIFLLPKPTADGTEEQPERISLSDNIMNIINIVMINDK